MLSRVLVIMGCAASASALVSSAVAQMHAPAAAAAAARTAVPLMASAPMATFEGAKTGTANVDLKVAKAAAYVVQRKVVAEQANMRLWTARATAAVARRARRCSSVVVRPSARVSVLGSKR